MAQTTRHFLDLDQIKAAELRQLLTEAKAMKAARKGLPKGALDPSPALKGRMLAMIFEKPSTRTRISFDLAMRQAGGETMTLSGNDLQFGHGETVADTARVLTRFVDVLMLRTHSHDSLVELAEIAGVPVINGLTNRTHPCQLMADVMAFEEHRGPIAGHAIAWLGAGNNVCASWIHAAERFGFTLRVSTPKGLEPPAALMTWAKEHKANVSLVRDPMEAAKGASAIVTDTWIQMSESTQLGEGGARARHKALLPYQVNDRIMERAGPDAVFLHCLPAHRGEEVTDQVIDSAKSIVFDAAENRLHTQKAILKWVLTGPA